MELTWFFKSFLIFAVGTFILRIGGRKSISQMTISQTIVMIGLGSLLVQPIADKGLLITFGASLTLIIFMILSEFSQMKIDLLETIFSGKAVIIIEDGVLNFKNLKKLRLTMDKLETRLRQVGISSIEDVKHATIEVSGQLGYELKDNKKPLSREDFIKLLNEIPQLKNQISMDILNNDNNANNIFKEIPNKTFEGNKNEP